MSQQIITFGLHLDGQRAFQPGNRLGEAVVGPLGFLNILETQLGLLADHPSLAERVVQYRDCLMRADTVERFYHHSFDTDPLGTASTLLGWRDLWHLHGWNGRMVAGAGRRLSDLAAVEESARESVSSSVGERLARVLVELDRRRPPIKAVLLVDPLAAFPPRWREVLARLPLTEVAEEAAGGAGFLGRLQENLRKAGANQNFDKVDWQDDGTVTVARSETRSLAAGWLAAQMDGAAPTLLVCGADGSRLDAHLAGAGRPRQGFKEASAFRPALQVLPLALEILWEPLNFYGLVQFLTHPVCPVPGFARRRLAAKVADAPGIGGMSWQRALEEIDDHYGADEAPKIREKIRLWVEHPRYGQAEGAPVTAALERIRLLADFFRARLGDTDPAKRISFNAGYAQCHACAAALEALHEQGVEKISPRQLQKLVTQATANGIDNPLLAAEVGAQLAITHPGAAVEPVDRVLWWQPGMPALPHAYPWSAAELRALAEADVDLPSTEDRLAQAGREWLRPILAARDQLTLVLPPEGEEVHPVWQMIRAVVTEEKEPLVEPLEKILEQGSPATCTVKCTPLPAPKRWWRLPDDIAVPHRETESFSSLELLIFNPYHWLLKYPAALRPSNIVNLGGDFRMLGNLAHGLVERYYRTPEALKMSDAEFGAWFDPAFEALVSEEGALLRMPGRGADLEGFRYRLLQSVQALRQQVAKAGVARVEPEMALTGSFPGGELSGFADLMMEKTGGERAIVDMKWSGAKKYPDKLKQNAHLQLAIYAELLRQKTGAWPSVAYYVLDRGRLFAPDDRAFPAAEVVASDSGENTAQLWQRFVASWKWRKAQIEDGAFEVALESIPETDESVPPEEAMAPEYLNESYNDCRALAGWEQ